MNRMHSRLTLSMLLLFALVTAGCSISESVSDSISSPFQSISGSSSSSSGDRRFETAPDLQRARCAAGAEATQRSGTSVSISAALGFIPKACDRSSPGCVAFSTACRSSRSSTSAKARLRSSRSTRPRGQTAQPPPPCDPPADLAVASEHAPPGSGPRSACPSGHVGRLSRARDGPASGRIGTEADSTQRIAEVDAGPAPSALPG